MNQESATVGLNGAPKMLSKKEDIKGYFMIKLGWVDEGWNHSNLENLKF